MLFRTRYQIFRAEPCPPRARTPRSRPTRTAAFKLLWCANLRPLYVVRAVSERSVSYPPSTLIPFLDGPRLEDPGLIYAVCPALRLFARGASALRAKPSQGRSIWGGRVWCLWSLHFSAPPS